MSDKIIARVHHHIRRNLPLAKHKELAPETELHADLEAKTLDLLQLVMDLEDEWPGRVYFTDEDAENIRTVGDVQALVLAQMQQEQPA